MMLAHADLTQQLCMQNYDVMEWIIESPDLFAQYVEELLTQIAGQDGGFVLSQDDKELVMAKAVEMIVNPLTVDVNEKKILNKVYSELANLANGEEMYLRTREVLGLLHQYFGELEYHYTNTVTVEDEFDLQGLLKALGVKVEVASGDYFEKLIQYIKLLNDVLNKKLVILVNIRSYLSLEKVAQLVEFAKYNEINLLLIESMQREFTDVTKKFIIDADGCEI